MIDIPLDANVECADGPGGRSSYVIIDPTTEQVTHYVVKGNVFHRTERLVPVDWIVETTPDLIRLRCTRDELATLEPFVETRLVRRKPLVYDPATWPMLAVPEQTDVRVRVKLKRVPEGELAVHRGAQANATDGRAGQVDEFMVDPETWHITHLVLREGHLWGQKEVTIPVREIDCIGEDTVYLRLDKHTIESLPAIPVRRL